MTPVATWDVVVLGGGPAGSTIARMLARWGHKVLLYSPEDNKPARAESLPPSIRNLFELLEIRDRIDAAGFYPDGGNTSWWSSSTPREEHFAPGATGWHVDRRKFDALLRDLAVESGVTVTTEHPASKEPRFLIDCTGRFGMIAQHSRIIDNRYRTACFGAEWTGQWDAEPTHALIEAYEDGWAWSVPLGPNTRHLAFMVDHGRNRGGVRKAYADELAKTQVLSRLFAGSTMTGVPWASDASLYRAREYATSSWLLVGDAGCTVDPLSSFGVKKALISAWVGAVTVNTCLTRPDLAGAAIQLFNDREQQTFSDHARQAAIQFGELTTRFPTKFWQSRAILSTDLQLYDPESLRLAHESLRSANAIQLRLTKSLSLHRVPAIAGREVVLLDRLVIPGLPSTIEYIQGVNLVELARIAEKYQQVPDLFEAYNATATVVALPNFIAALSFLLANGILTNQLAA